MATFLKASLISLRQIEISLYTRRKIPAKTNDIIEPTLRNIRDVLFIKLPHLNYNVFAAYKNLHNEKCSSLMLFTLSTY